jgi:hypothetical protein
VTAPHPHWFAPDRVLSAARQQAVAAPAEAGVVPLRAVAPSAGSAWEKGEGPLGPYCPSIVNSSRTAHSIRCFVNFPDSSSDFAWSSR